MAKYNMRNLQPDSPRDETERFYIVEKIEEKEKQIGGIECVLTFEYHYAGGPRFNTRPLKEAEQMKNSNERGPAVIKYWRKNQFLLESVLK